MDLSVHKLPLPVHGSNLCCACGQERCACNPATGDPCRILLRTPLHNVQKKYFTDEQGNTFIQKVVFSVLEKIEPSDLYQERKMINRIRDTGIFTNISNIIYNRNVEDRTVKEEISADIYQLFEEANEAATSTANVSIQSNDSIVSLQSEGSEMNRIDSSQLGGPENERSILQQPRSEHIGVMTSSGQRLQDENSSRSEMLDKTQIIPNTDISAGHGSLDKNAGAAICVKKEVESSSSDSLGGTEDNKKINDCDCASETHSKTCTRAAREMLRDNSPKREAIVELGERCDFEAETFSKHEDLELQDGVGMTKPYCYPSTSGSQDTESDTQGMSTDSDKHDEAYSCKYCVRTFSNANLHADHETSCCGKPFQCKKCDCTFATKRALLQHRKIHLPEKTMHMCTTCGEEYKSRQKLLLHMKTHSLNQSSNICNICGKDLTSHNALRKHRLRVHSIEQPFECDVCHKQLKTFETLRSHKKTHEGEKFFCDVCNKAFHYKLGRDIHMRSHTGERPYICDICGRSYVDSSGLKRHLRAHSGERPFICDQCGKGFIESYQLVDHKRHVHAADRPYYPCSSCESKFSAKSSLVFHVRRVHLEEKNVFCKECGKVFFDKHGLRRHINSTHSVDRERHFKCSVCSFEFLHSYDLKRHARIHAGVKPFKCDSCEKSFLRKSHLVLHSRTHTGEKPFMCNICGKAFTQSNSLRIHTQKVHKPDAESV